ncbi:MAG: heme exporter protein CcmD [Pseudomonadota bacterium]
MQFESLNEFFAMGGHGLYVWLAYGATFLVLVGVVVVLKIRHARLLRTLRWQYMAQQNIQQDNVQDAVAGMETNAPQNEIHREY